ncbi:hypothetical protein KP77_11850 [Jeotgalibacillus alimentarius]|uniref:Uncharacterized protein n=2 Tax=Jeotgalibacillus TaxID=157226 RepID=A0A0C2W6L5_9BACL|nr:MULTISPECIES: hypothetical protein [Jeotgalibacillus]KIL51673.1 hypothetical protein KP77_11850 [Jeotgalibacillus alimentarius]MBM7578059.1 hypothetical protein [Jeotgalibacillus terrae]
MFITITAIVSALIWCAVSYELIKPVNDKKIHNKKKVFTLMSAGSVTTLILTISLLQGSWF